MPRKVAPAAVTLDENSIQAVEVLASVADTQETTSFVDGSPDTAGAGALVTPDGVVADQLLNHSTGQMQDVRPTITHRTATKINMYKKMGYGWKVEPVPKSNMLTLMAVGWTIRAPAEGLQSFPVFYCPETLCNKPIIDEEAFTQREHDGEKDENFVDLGLNVGNGSKTRLLNLLDDHIHRAHKNRKDLMLQVAKRMNEEASNL